MQGLPGLGTQYNCEMAANTIMWCEFALGLVAQGATIGPWYGHVTYLENSMGRATKCTHGV